MQKKRDLGRIYVTGADGFIGSHLVEVLLEFNYEVTALCLYNSFGSYGWLNELSHKKPDNLTLLLGDVRDPFFMKSTVKGHQTVFHLAALIAIPFSYAAPQSYFETNVLGTLNTMQACLDAGVGRYIHTSTSEVYGSARFIPMDESHPLQGQSPYSASKIGADMAVESYFRSLDLPAVTLRPFNTYGPRQSLRAVIPSIISQALSKRNEIKVGSMDTIRDFNFVHDTVNAFISVAQASDESVLGHVFNTGSGREISIGELVDLIWGLTQSYSKITVESGRLRPQKSEVERLFSNPTKLKLATGWEPNWTLEAGIKRTIEWISKRKDYIEASDKYTV